MLEILEFHSGNEYTDVNISIINDESFEGNETFTIYLTSDVGSTYIETEVTIIDDDEGNYYEGTWTLYVIGGLCRSYILLFMQ